MAMAKVDAKWRRWRGSCRRDAEHQNSPSTRVTAPCCCAEQGLDTEAARRRRGNRLRVGRGIAATGDGIRGSICRASDKWIVSEVHSSNGKRRYYGLDGGNLVCLQQESEAEAMQMRRRIVKFTQRMFFPEGGKDAVTEDYWHFSYWNFVRSVVSSCNSVLGTQGLLRALGLSATNSIATSAAVNWVLKDGLGRLGCIIAAFLIGNKFDNDAKLFSFCGDVIYELGILLELISPACSSLFLLVASLANALKSISYMSRLPPRAAILKSFALKENVGDISAKANCQDVASGMIGLALGIQVSYWVGPSMWKAFVAYVLSALIVGFSSLKALSRLELKTLNFHRLQIAVDHFVQSDSVLTPKQVNAEENVLSSWNLFETDFKVVYGADLVNGYQTGNFGEVLEMFKGEQYLIRLQEQTVRGKAMRMRVLVHVQEQISPRSIMFSMLHIAYIKRRFQLRKAATARKANLGDGDFNPIVEVQQTYKICREMFSRFYESLEEKGWSIEHILVTPTRYITFRSDQKKEEDAMDLPSANKDWRSPTQVVMEPQTIGDATCNTQICETPTGIIEVSSTDKKGK